MKNRQEFYDQSRKDHPVFTYNSYDFKLTDTSLEITYSFSADGMGEFRPTWNISRIKGRKASINRNILDEMIFSLGMVELISYWKIACPPTVIIKERRLTPPQIGWWKKLYFNGLDQFYYTNGIKDNFDDFMNIVCNGSAKETEKAPTTPSVPTVRFGHKRPAILMPVGGGKDSVVTLELLKENADCFGYVINPDNAKKSTLEISGLADRTILAERTLDPLMLEFNEKGYLNGHTPFSAVVAFSSIIAAYINDLEFDALSNELKPSEWVVEDMDVNPQYSKSFEFESDFRAYERKCFGSGVYYFSLLRPLSSLQVAMLFSKYKNYHSIFKSCDVSKSDDWCCHCLKCLFVYIILSPFLPLEELDGIFNRRLFEEAENIEAFDKLCGYTSVMPFEFAGSTDEVRAAIDETISKYESEGIKLPLLLSHYKEMNLSADKYFEDYKKQFSTQHGLTPYFKNIVQRAIQ